MHGGDLLTRLMIWIALIGYGFGASHLLSNRNPKWERAARWAWTLACVCLIVHVALAFHFFHDWNHAAAYAETARQTAEVFGPNWGGGLFINYALMLIWLIDAGWWWIDPEAHRRQPKWFFVAWHAFLIFIIFNATVVFVAGPLRWLGLGLCLWLIFRWRSGWSGKTSLSRDALANQLSKE